MENPGERRVIVAGTGPAGLCAALALAEAGFGVDLVGPAAVVEDRRTTALMLPALDMLAAYGVLERLESQAAPLAVMRIVDASSRLLRSPVVTFRAAEIDKPWFGLNIPNEALNAALADAVAERAEITRHDTLVENWRISPQDATALLPGGKTLSAPLAVAADGRNSPARAAAGIKVHRRNWRQAALVLSFAHARGHESTSTEFHTETGPFTQVPLPGRRSSLVWVVEPQTANELAALDDDALSRRIEDRMQSMLGRVEVEEGRQVYPLAAITPSRFARNRIALVGEAAHVFPPIGAQGLNLGLRDVRDLAATIARHAGDPGGPAALAAYDMRRRPDILARTAAVNLLNRSLLSDMLPSQFARSSGLAALAAFSPLRVFFMREGLAPGSGFSTLFSDMRERLRG